MMSAHDRYGILRSTKRRCQRAWNKIVKAPYGDPSAIPHKEAYAAATERMRVLEGHWPEEAEAYLKHQESASRKQRNQMLMQTVRKLRARLGRRV